MVELLYTARYADSGNVSILFPSYLGYQQPIPLANDIALKVADAIGQQSDVTLKLRHSHGRLTQAIGNAGTSKQCHLDAEFEDPDTGAIYGARGYGDTERNATLHAFICALRQRKFMYVLPTDYRSAVVWSDGV